MSAKKTKPKTNGDAPAPKPAGPPYEMTVEEETEYLARWRFRRGDLDYEVEKCGTVLDDIAYEVTGIAEGITEVLHGGDGAAYAHKHVDSLMAHAKALADVSARMMRYAGRLEGYREAQGRADKGEEMIEAWKSGGLGTPAPPAIEVGRTVRRMRDGTESEAAE